MGRYCIVGGCSNTSKSGVSLFQFPKDAYLRGIWTNKIVKTKAKWKGPTKNSAVCCDHFTADCLESTSATSLKLGFKMKQMLRPGAVPTIFPHISSSSVSVTKPHTSRACEKRECLRMLSESAEVPSVEEAICMDHQSPDFLGTTSCTLQSIATQANLRVPAKSARVQVKPNSKNKATQADIKPLCIDIGIQCDIGIQSNTHKCEQPTTPPTPVIEPIISPEEDDDLYEPPKTNLHSLTENRPHKERKYIVFESNLLEIFRRCPRCGISTEPITYTIGTFVGIVQQCEVCDYTHKWASQPITNNVPMGNLLLSASILFAGALPTKTLRVFEILNCAAISLSTYHAHQNTYLHPTILNVWNREQAVLIEMLQALGEPISLGGDGRSDSPGHSAKYGSYTFLDLEHDVILDVELVQSTEVKSSNNMEKEGLIRGLNFLEKNNLFIDLLVTDRHKEINAWLRLNKPEIKHRYDVWHVAKSFRKKLNKLAKEKGCGIVGDWSKSMINHLYWCVSSTSDGDEEVLLEKWLSLLNHMHNKHQGHGKKYRSCTHSPLRNRKWLKYHTKPSEKLSDIVRKKQMCTDVQKLSTTYQTSNVEAFHSLIIQFAPKHTAFSYSGMMSRLCLAALHYNHNSGKKQAKNKKGEMQYSILFPKYKQGGYIVRKVMTKSDYGYVDDLLSELVAIHHAGSKLGQASLHIQEFLCSKFTRPNKTEAVKEKTTRFSVSS